MLVTALAGAAWTVTRAPVSTQEGTLAATHAVGATVSHVLTAGGLSNFLSGQNQWGNGYFSVMSPQNPSGAADATGAVDSTASIAAAITACPKGGVVLFPPGFYKFSTLTINKSITLLGVGYVLSRDNLAAFGAAAYGTLTNFGGSVLISTATAGVAITGTVTETDFLHVLGLLIIGPGIGTSTGIQYGNASFALTEGRFDVGAVNFATGASVIGVEDSDLHLFIMGCTNAGGYSTNANQNTSRLDVQKCVNGWTDDATCLANVYINPIHQANTGTSIVLQGANNSFVGGWFENPAGVRALDIFGIGNIFIGTLHANATDAVRINSGALNTRFINPQVSVAQTWIDNGGGTKIEGRLNLLTVTGSDISLILEDLSTGTFNSEAGLSANDADANRYGWKAGADGTLGPSQLLLYGHPSATAANRFWALRHQDNAAYRTLKLNDLGGQVALASAGFDTSVGGNIRHSKQSPVFNAAPAPNATLGEIYAMAALTGNVVVANPVNVAQGQRLKFYWTQDGTGTRTVTYGGANFRSTGIAAQSTAASTVTIDEAECIDGTIWRVTRLVTGQTV
jgi:hypothetical protein